MDGAGITVDPSAATGVATGSVNLREGAGTHLCPACLEALDDGVVVWLMGRDLDSRDVVGGECVGED